MAGAKGSALEWALALLRAPGERHVLRSRPLPMAVDVLLSVAAETNLDALAPLAAEWGEPPERLQEAARFYAREILFHPQADAYRVLGLDASASAEAIKTHHRLLQRWLHPDRQHAADDSVFAARVNKAWDHLRSPERRAAYDLARASQRVPEVVDSGEALRALPDWRAVTPAGPPPVPRWRRRAPVYALLAACLVLAWLGVRDAVTQPDPAIWSAGAEPPPQADPDLTLPVRTARTEPATVTRRTSGKAPTRPARPVAPPRAKVPTPESPALAANVPQDTPEPPLPTVIPPTVVVASAPIAQRAPAPEVSVAPARVAPPVSAPDPLPARVEAPSPLAAAPTPVAPVRDDGTRSAMDSARPASADASAAFARVQQARQAGQQLLTYMASPGRSPPPIWNSPAIQSSADQLRQDLHRAGRQRFGAAQWKIGEQTAVVSAPTGQGARGRLSADLVWREGRWLVTGLSLEQPQ